MKRMGLMRHWVLPSTGVVLGLAALTIGLINATTISPVEAQEPMSRVLTVTGRGSEQTPATLAQVELGVEAQGDTAAAVQQEVAQRSAAVLERLRSQNVDKLQTTGIRLNPQYNYEGRRPRITGYIGANTVSFEMPTDQVGPLLDDAIAAGANQINRVSFVATEDAIAAAREAALQQATADAQAQADTVLRSLNLSTQEIVGIQINQATPPMPIPYARAQRVDTLAAAEVSTPVEGGEQTVNARVTLQIRY